MINENLFSRLSEFTGEVSLYFKDLKDGEIININDRTMMQSASVIKIPLVAAILNKVKEGSINLEDEVRISKENMVRGTGVICHLNNVGYTINDLAKLAIILSDNTATNMLIDIVGGLEEVNKYCVENNFGSISFQRKMLDLEALNAGKDNFANTNEIGVMLEKLYLGQLNGRKYDDLLIDYMKVQQYRDKLPAKIPVIESYDSQLVDGIIPEGRVVVANKTGNLWNTQNDAGIFFLPDENAYILSIFTTKIENADSGIRLIAEISEIIYNYVLSKY